jgi:hypothetical protein
MLITVENTNFYIQHIKNKLLISNITENKGWDIDLKISINNSNIYHIGKSNNHFKTIDINEIYIHKPKMLICIAFHYVENNIKYLKKVLNNIYDNYEFEVDVVIDTNTELTYELKKIYPKLNIIVHKNLSHGFHLTWMHRQYIKDNYKNYDLVMYSEDDILIPFYCIVDFLNKIDIMWPYYIPNFRRIEWNDNKQIYTSCDITEPINLNTKEFIYLPDINNIIRKYISVDYAYQAFWILPSKYLQINNEFTNVSVYREHASSYTLGPPPHHGYTENNIDFRFLNMKPLLEITETNEIYNQCIVYHTPNKYIDLYTVPLVNHFNLNNNINKKIDVSLAEILDKYSILEIKYKYLKNNDVLNELNILSFCKEYINLYKYEYSILYTINHIIWQLMDDTQYDISYKNSIKIFKENDARSRIKKRLNDLLNSNIKEVKSYNNKSIKFDYPKTLHPTILNLYIEYLKCYYDEIIIDSNIDSTNSITLTELYEDFNPSLFNVINKYKNLDFTVKNYICGGLFGDLFYVCYVMMCKFLSNNIKANFYIDDTQVVKGVDYFDVNKTYNDICSYIKKLPYINDFNICIDRNIEYIDLDKWRNITCTDFINTFINNYNIDRYNIPWLYCYNLNFKYKNNIFIHRSLRRYNDKFPWNDILSKNECTFISFTEKEYNNFKNTFNTNINLLLCKNVEEFINIIYNSKYFICNLTSLSAITMGLKLKYLCEVSPDSYIHYIGLNSYNPNVSLFL